MTIRKITGTVEYANGAIPKNSRLEFYLNGIHIDAVAIAHSAVYTPLDETGDIIVDLYPNDVGYGADRYNVDLVTYSDSEYIREIRRVNLGKIYVADEDGQILQDLLAVFTGPAIPLGVAQQAAQDAIDAAELAASFAGSIDPSSFAVKSENLSDLTDSDAALVNLGLTASATELNYVDGVTSPIQTQLNGKQASGATLTSLEALALVAGDIIYATAADTLARLPKGTAGQGLVMNAGATAPKWGVPTMTPAYQSADLASTSAVTHTLTHGLGGQPSMLQVWLKCLTAEHGYAVGDWYGPVSSGASNGVGIAVGATNIKLVVGSSGIGILNASMGVGSTITPARWAIVARAWA